MSDNNNKRRHDEHVEESAPSKKKVKDQKVPASKVQTKPSQRARADEEEGGARVSHVDEEKKYINDLVTLKAPKDLQFIDADGQILIYNSAVKLFAYLFDHMQRVHAQMKLEYLEAPFKGAMEVWDRFFGENLRDGDYQASMRLLHAQMMFMVEGKDDEGMIKEMIAFLEERKIDHDIQDVSSRDILALGDAIGRMDRFVKNMIKIPDDIFKNVPTPDAKKAMAETISNLSTCEQALHGVRSQMSDFDKVLQEIKNIRASIESQMQKDTPVILALRELKEKGPEIIKFVAESTRDKILDKYMAGYRMYMLQKKMDDFCQNARASQNGDTAPST